MFHRAWIGVGLVVDVQGPERLINNVVIAQTKTVDKCISMKNNLNKESKDSLYPSLLIIFLEHFWRHSVGVSNQICLIGHLKIQDGYWNHFLSQRACDISVRKWQAKGLHNRTIWFQQPLKQYTKIIQIWQLTSLLWPKPNVYAKWRPSWKKRRHFWFSNGYKIQGIIPVAFKTY